MGPLLRESGRRKSEALLSAPLGISATCPANHAAEPRGAREAACQHRLPRDSRRQKISLLRIQWGPVPEELAWSSERVQAVRLRSGSRDCGAVKLLSTQIVRKQAKALFIFNAAAHCVQLRRQRFPTVRTVRRVGNGEVRAKTADIRACASTAIWQRCEFIGDSR
jgi:hypothetical protein